MLRGRTLSIEARMGRDPALAGSPAVYVYGNTAAAPPEPVEEVDAIPVLAEEAGPLAPPVSGASPGMVVAKRRRPWPRRRSPSAW
jgi:hypothetical protein